MDLVILAAGLGSRFKGLKQIEKVGPNGEMLIEYSIYDAIKAGFKRVVFIIKKENLKYFKPLEKNMEKYIEVKYAFQENNLIKREKPLGTAHAIMCAKEVINDKFMVINADDFYGRESFNIGFDFLKNSNEYGLIGYKAINTLSKNGSVNRGVCEVEGNVLKKIKESSLELILNEIICIRENRKISLDKNALVSMNMLIFDKTVFSYIEREYEKFLENYSDDKEFYIPDVLNEIVKTKKCIVIETPSVWYGITYREDLKQLKEYINKQVKEKVYPKHLW